MSGLVFVESDGEWKMNKKQKKILEELRIYFEKMSKKLEREEKRSWKIYTIVMFLIVIFDITYVIWTKSLAVGISLGFVFGLWLGSWMKRTIDKRFG